MNKRSVSYILLTIPFLFSAVNLYAADEYRYFPCKYVGFDLTIDTIPESDCSDGIDNNGNGLTDVEESSCYFYFDSISKACQPTQIIWGSSDKGIHWKNVVTGEEKLVMASPENDYFVDMAWVPQNKLYAIGESHIIYEIDVLTGEMKDIDFVSGYRPVGMTSDATGMLYIVAYATPEKCELLQFDPLTNKVQIISTISNYGLLASGDCCFLDGYLYVSCEGYIGRVDIKNGLVEKFAMTNLLINHSWGISTLGDGFLYVTDNGQAIYRVDPVTMTETPFVQFTCPRMSLSGFASYLDPCNAPCTQPRVWLGADTIVCKNANLLLKNIAADNTVVDYVWSNGNTEQFNSITVAGTYWLTAKNSCEMNSDTVVVIAGDKPLLSLGKDTVICEKRPVLLANKFATGTTYNYLWSDNSTLTELIVNAPGTYSLEVSNACGRVSDTILVNPKVDDCQCKVFIPSAFTPNADNLNDRFNVSSNCSWQGTIQIFNRWGDMVYNSDNVYAGWNGVSSGKLQPADVYVYVVRYSYIDFPGAFTRKGTVTLIK